MYDFSSSPRETRIMIETEMNLNVIESALDRLDSLYAADSNSLKHNVKWVKRLCNRIEEITALAGW